MKQNDSRMRPGAERYAVEIFHRLSGRLELSVINLDRGGRDFYARLTGIASRLRHA
jgi:hypothetical protein